MATVETNHDQNKQRNRYVPDRKYASKAKPGSDKCGITPSGLNRLEWRDINPGVLQRLSYPAPDLDRSRRVAVNADGVGAHFYHLAGDRHHSTILHHAHHALGNRRGVVQYRAGLAARYQ